MILFLVGDAHKGEHGSVPTNSLKISLRYVNFFSRTHRRVVYHYIKKKTVIC